MGANDDPAGESGPAAAVSLSLYVQPPVAGAKVETIDRLSALDAADAIADFDVQTVRGEFIVSQHPDGGVADLPGYLEAAVAWTAGDLRPTFEVEEVRSRLGRSVRRLSLPGTVLVVCVDGEPACVFPCTDGTRAWTVEDFLDSYEASREPPERIGIDLRTT